MSSEALAKPIITRNSSEFKLDAYASLSAAELVVFAVQVLQADTAPVAVEEVVSTCFRLFPHSFALKNYFYWPDSALVTRRLHDAKEKGLLKGSATDGYETKVQGRQVAKHVAKTLGVSLPIPPKVEVILPPVVELPKVAEIVKKEEEKKEVIPSAPAVKEAKKQETRKKKVQQKAPAKKAVVKKAAVKPKAQKKVAAPVKKKSVTKPKVTAVKVEKKEERKKKEVLPKPKVEKVVEKKREISKKEVKPTVKPVAKKVEPKVEKVTEKKREASKKEVQPAVKPVVKKVEPKVEKKEERAKKEAKPQPTQLTMALTPPTAWKKAEAPATKPKVKKEPLPIKGEVLAPVAVSKEEKDKAAKVIKQIERSDAYQLYRRNGRRAQIGEFDFRNMLFATMESSPETLKRNLDLFKRYAGIHFRTDLIAFLEFCEENFSALMISKVKGKK